MLPPKRQVVVQFRGAPVTLTVSSVHRELEIRLVVWLKHAGVVHGGLSPVIFENDFVDLSIPPELGE
eukprot:11169974-Lingulodinium_polyedra.AAC.1